MAYKQSGWSAFTNKKLKKAEKQMEKLKASYSSIPTYNTNLNMNNVYEDMTINKKQFELESEQNQQNTVDILGELKETGGSSSAATLAQVLAEENRISSQKISSRIGSQEKENNMKKALTDSAIQNLEREGEISARNAELRKQETLLSMSKQERDAQRKIASDANKAKWGAIQSGVDNISNTLKS